MRSLRLTLLVTALSLVVGQIRAQTIDLYNRLLDPVALARLDEPGFVRSRFNYGMGFGYAQSSTDPGYWRCAEDTGAGIITHLFVTARTPDSATDYRLYIDDKLFYHGGLDGFFSRSMGMMRPPFDTIIGEARLCDVQIPYHHGFKLLYKSTDGRLFYNYGWRPLPSFATLPMTSGIYAADVLQSQSAAEAVYRNRDLLWDGFGGEEAAYATSLAKGSSDSVLYIRGPALARELRIEVDTYTVALDSVWIDMTYDDAATPQFAAPLMALFAQSYDFRPLYSLPIVFSRDSGFVMRFPIPFVHSLRLAFRNTSSRAFQINGHVTWRSYPVNRTSFGYFHSHFSETPLTQWLVPHHVFRTVGRGRYVGMLMGIHNLHNGATYEGDPIFTVDSSHLYSFHYDGMEDYFDGAQYFSHGEFFSPFGGTSNLFANYYRFHYLDAINFTKSLDLDFQHGVANNCWEHYRTLAFWYEQPTRFWTDKDSVRMGASLTVAGAAYQPGEKITIEAAQSSSPSSWFPLGTATANTDGRFSSAFPILRIVEGTYRLRVNGEISPHALLVHKSASLQIVSEPRPLSVQTNDTIHFDGEGFAPNDSIIALVGPKQSECRYTIDTLARLHGWLVVPYLPDGKYVLSVTGLISGEATASDLITNTRTLRYEGELLWDSTSSAPGLSSRFNTSWLYNWDWSRMGVALMKPEHQGDTLGLRFYLPEADTFRVWTKCALGTRYGIYDIALDGHYCATLDPYKDVEQTPSDSIILGMFALSKGDHRVTYTFRNKTALGTDSVLWADYIELSPLSPLSVESVKSEYSASGASILSPDPVTSRTLTIEAADDEEYLDVVTASGVRILHVVPRSGQYTLDLHSTPNGTYFLRSSTGRTGRFILER